MPCSRSFYSRYSYNSLWSIEKQTLGRPYSLGCLSGSDRRGPEMGIRTILIKSIICLLIGLVFSTVLLCQESQENVLNPRGWNLPDTSRLTLKAREEMAFPGVPVKITCELWIARPGSHYQITNLPRCFSRGRTPDLDPTRMYFERPQQLLICKAKDGRPLCYDYECLVSYLQTAPEPSPWFGVRSLICDLDGDGIFESQFGRDNSEEYNRMRASVLRIKLGVSTESDLVRRLVKATVENMGERPKKAPSMP